jgi:hypothetical protein
VRWWQNELRATVGHDTVMACRSLLYRILQAAEDDRRIEANSVRKVPAPKSPVDPASLLRHAKRRAYTRRNSGTCWQAPPPFYRDQFICLAGTGLRAGPFGSGYRNRPKSPASIRAVPLAGSRRMATLTLYGYWHEGGRHAEVAQKCFYDANGSIST